MRPLEAIAGYRMTLRLCEGGIVDPSERFGQIAAIAK
jgi:hypothetical protein